MEEQTEIEGEATAPAQHKKLTVAVAVVLCVVFTLGVFFMFWYLDDDYPDFENNFTEEFAIPALNEGFIPQGMGSYKDDSETYFFISGYMNDGSASRIYVVTSGGEDGYRTVGYVTIIMPEDGESDGESEVAYYAGHACGVATNGTKLWLAGDSTVYVMSYSDVIDAAETDGSVELATTIDAKCAADFCYYDGTYLYVGEFYRSGNYETDESHRFTTPAGDENKAIILRYKVTSTTTSINTTPDCAYSITGLVQGMAIFNDDATGEARLALSASYGLKNSHILIYDLKNAESTSNRTLATLEGISSSVYVYYIDSDYLLEDYEIPSMSEGMCTVGDRVYVLFESAGAKYKLFVRERLYNVYSFSY